MKKALSKEEIVRRIEKASEAEDLYPGILGMLGNPVTFAARWGLPLSRGYRNFKAQQLRAEKRRWARAKNGGHTLRSRPSPKR